MQKLSAVLLLGTIGTGVLQGCAATPLARSELHSTEQPIAEVPFDAPLQIRTLDADQHYAQLTSAVIAHRLDALASEGPIDILALSGGGAGGAFGAGAIVGLTESGRRPQFAVVTGVSAGALIAPYAFLGSKWDHELEEIYAGGLTEHILQSRGLGAVFGSSLYRGQPLRQLVDRFATDTMMHAIASEAAKGRLLLVATTEVNTGEPVIWDLGAIALHGGRGARKLFRDVLVASASVPGLFPPVVIGDKLHVDGAVTTPFFFAPSPADIAGNWAAGEQRPNLYVIIDGPLSEQPQTPHLRISQIVSRSVSAGLNQLLRTTLELNAATAQQRGLMFDYSSIPLSYPYRGAFDFSGDTVRPLFAYAYNCARSGRLWTAYRPPAGEGTPTEALERRAQVPCPADGTMFDRFGELRQ